MKDFTQKIALGTVQFGMNYGISNVSGQTSKNEVESLLEYASSIGLDILDTAYGYGESESTLGNFDLNNFKIISKFLPEDVVGESMESQLSESLSRLKINSFYGYLAHRSANLINQPDLWQRLKKLQQKGLIEKIGISFNDPNEIEEVLTKGIYPDLIQVPYNYFDKRFEKWMIKLKNEYKTEIHTRSTFLQGLFFTEVSALPKFFNQVIPEIEKLQKLTTALPSSLLLNSLRNEYIDKVVIGVENVDQLENNLAEIETARKLPIKDFNFPSKIITPSEWPR